MSCLRCLRTTGPALAVALSCAAPCGVLTQVAAQAPAGAVEPISRVQYQAAAQPAAGGAVQVAARIVPEATVPPPAPFDLTQLPGEHPLMPALRVAKEALANIDQNIQDYQAIMIKQERIDGELMEKEVAFVKVRHQRFSVYMFFLAPNKGRECLYVAGPNGEEGRLFARDSGFKRKFGVFEFGPHDRMVMKGQKYPITKLGVRNLTTELIDVASKDVNYGECEVRTVQTELGAQNGEKRPVTLLEVTHPVPRKNFRFHKAQVFIDNELRVPIRYAAYLWPSTPGGELPLEEEYTYLNLKVNNGFTDATFAKDNPEIFKD